MSDYNTMTAQACADWLAERERWEPWNGGWRREIPERREYEYRDDHPFALTLDAAAAALREPWGWDEILWYTTTVYVQIRNVKTHERTGFEYFDELTARYRAAVAARMEDDK